jgi:hypothetical protein
MTRDTELYYKLEKLEQITCLINSQFPATNSQDLIDDIISDCWLGKFERITDVSKQVSKVTTFDEVYQIKKKECENYYQQLQSLT